MAIEKNERRRNKEYLTATLFVFVNMSIPNLVNTPTTYVIFWFTSCVLNLVVVEKIYIGLKFDSTDEL